mmetsp:Transcript_16855/g.42298  ORF Transcript_16855/g.42298 Transcript_16855/m.42298 type:complete len:210 (-) Transcript_16855:896-1525(-)
MRMGSPASSIRLSVTFPSFPLILSMTWCNTALPALSATSSFGVFGALSGTFTARTFILNQSTLKQGSHTLVSLRVPPDADDFLDTMLPSIGEALPLDLFFVGSARGNFFELHPSQTSMPQNRQWCFLAFGIFRNASLQWLQKSDLESGIQSSFGFATGTVICLAVISFFDIPRRSDQCLIEAARSRRSSSGLSARASTPLQSSRSSLAP